MTIIYVSDFDLRGSGYMNIAAALCSQLAERGFDVLALGLGYDGGEHDFPFRIVPAEMRDVVPMVRQLQASQVKTDAVVVALDIPLQDKLLNVFGAPCDLPYIGLFPLEGPPLCMPWAMSILRMDARLIMSRCGLEWMETAGVDGRFIPIGIDPLAWRPAYDEERTQIRAGLGIAEDTFVVLTVADNQERKNLSRSLEIFADFSVEVKAMDPAGYPVRVEGVRDTIYYMVTRPGSIVGYKLDDYAMRCGVFDRLAMWDRGVPQKSLWSLFVAADVFLLTSKAEGLAMPVLEAMACRLPVVGTDCTAIAEHLTEGRGLLIEPEYEMVDPWGNSRRFMAGRQKGLAALWRLEAMGDEELGEMLDQAQAYAAKRTWERAGDVLVAAIGEAKQSREPVGVPIEQEAQVAA